MAIRGVRDFAANLEDENAAEVALLSNEVLRDLLLETSQNSVSKGTRSAVLAYQLVSVSTPNPTLRRPLPPEEQTKITQAAQNAWDTGGESCRVAGTPIDILILAKSDFLQASDLALAMQAVGYNQNVQPTLIQLLLASTSRQLIRLDRTFQRLVSLHVKDRGSNLVRLMEELGKADAQVLTRVRTVGPAGQVYSGPKSAPVLDEWKKQLMRHNAEVHDRELQTVGHPSPSVGNQGQGARALILDTNSLGRSDEIATLITPESEYSHLATIGLVFSEVSRKSITEAAGTRRRRWQRLRQRLSASLIGTHGASRLEIAGQDTEVTSTHLRELTGQSGPGPGMTDEHLVHHCEKSDSTLVTSDSKLIAWVQRRLKQLQVLKPSTD